MATNGGNINFNVNMTVNKNGLNQIVKPLQQIQRQINSMSTDKMSQEFQEAATSAKQLESIINSSWNDKLGQLNLDKFNQSVKNSYGSVSDLKASLSGAGAAGEQAFNNLAHSILNTNLQLRQSNKLLDDMATSMANTVKWGITSSIFNKITGSIQSAYYYAKDLDTSLNNIRIVTGQSADEMQRFAKIANTAAGDLGRSTLDYTKAALSFYQQGLSDEEVQARTNVTLKAQNITGVGSEMVDYLTSVWNGFKVEAEDAESYVDKLAKVADSSASDMSELAIAMSKVAATANMMGVDVDQLTAQLATVIATTRQAPESVGTAFKTIYSRLNDIQAGAEDAQISLGNYSGKMADLGFNVLDANGRLRDTGEVIEQIGSRWNTLSKEQQVYLAQIMGGQRQITQITALFENWTTYSELLNDSLSAQGTLNQKNDIYLESTAAHMQQLATETERTYDILFNQKTVNTFADVFKTALKTFNDYLAGIGGGINVFVNFGSVVANIFNKQIGNAINAQIQNIERWKANLNAIEQKQDIIKQIELSHNAKGEQITSSAALEREAEIAKKTLEVRKALTQEEYNQLTQLQNKVGLLQNQIDYINSYKQNLKEAGVNEEASYDYITRRLNAEKELLQIYKDGNTSLTELYYLSEEIQKGELKRAKNNKQIDLILKECKEDIVKMLESTNLLSEKDISSVWEKISILVKQGRFDQETIKEILDKQGISLEKQKEIVENLAIAAEKRKLIENGTAQEIERQANSAEKLAINMQDNAQRTIKFQDKIQKASGLIQAMSSAIGGIKVALDDSVSASERLNGVWAAGTGALSGVLNAFIPGSGFLVQGISGLIKSGLQFSGIWKDIEKRFETSAEKINKINESLKEVNTVEKNEDSKINALEAIQEEYEFLSQKAGDYRSTINLLTEEEKQRYFELTDEFSQYNQSVIVGYDNQGHAIVENQQALKATIELLKQQKRAAAEAAFAAGENNTEVKQSELLEPITKARENLNNAKIQKIESSTWTDKGMEDNFESFLSQISVFSENNSKEVQQAFIDKFLEVLNENGNPQVRSSLLNNDGTIPSDFWELTTNFRSLFSQGAFAENPQMLSAFSGFIYSLNNSNIGNQLFDFQKTDQLSNSLNNLINYFSQEYRPKITEMNKAIADAQVEVKVVQDQIKNGQFIFDSNWLVNKLKWGGEGYSQQYKELESSQFFDQSAYNAFIEYVSGFKYREGLKEALVQGDQKWASSYDDIIKYGQEKTEELSKTLQEYGNLFNNLSEKSQIDAQVIKTNVDQSVNTISSEIRRSIEKNWLSNETIQDIFRGEDENKKQYILSLIKQIYGLQDLDIYFNKQIDAVGIDSLKTLGNSIRQEILNVLRQTLTENENINNYDLQQYLFKWITDQKFNTDDLIKLKINLADILSFDTDTVQGFKDAQEAADYAKERIIDFFKESDEASQNSQIIDNFELLTSAISKLQDNKTLSYKEKTKLIEKLGLSAEDVQDADKLVSKLEESLNSLGKTDEDLVKRSEALPLVYNNLQKISKALKEEKISSEEADFLKEELFNSQLETLKITQEELKKFAETRNLAFNSSEQKLRVLQLYQEAQAAKVLADAEAQETKAKKQAIKAEEERALQKVKTKESIIPNAKSALSTLENKGTLSAEEANSLAYIEQVDENLQKVLEDHDRYSKEYLEALSIALQTQKSLTQEAKEEKLAILEGIEARQQEELTDLTSKRNNIEGKIHSKEDYNDAKLVLKNSDSASESDIIAARNITYQYQHQGELQKQLKQLEDQIAAKKQEILETQGEIIQVENESVEVSEEKNRKLTEQVDTFNKLGDALTSGSELSAEQMQQFEDILDTVLKEYPELQQEADLLKETWLAGTQAYSEALGEVGEALDQLMYKEIVGQVDEAFSALQDDLAELERLDFEVDPSDFDRFVDQVQTFLDADKTIAIRVHTDAENEFNRITQEMENIYQAAGKIGQNFIVAANDMRELNNVFPGILEGMQRLDDGSFQLNSNMVKRAIATAQSTTAADAQSVIEQLKQQSNLLHNKADNYKKMAEAAKVLSGVQTQSEMSTVEAKEAIIDGFAIAKAENAKLIAENELQNQEIITDSSKDNSEVFNKNWEGSAQASANSIYEFAKSAVDNLNTIARASAYAEQGIEFYPYWTPPSIRGGFTGTGGVSKQAAVLGKLNDYISEGTFSKESSEKLIAPLQRLGSIYEKAANDLDGMIVQASARSFSLQDLDNVVRGQGIKGLTQKDNSSKNTSDKTPSTKTTKEKEPKKEKETKKKETKKKETKKKQTKQKEEKVKEEKIKDPDVIDYLQEEAARYHDIDIEIKAIAKDLDKVQKIESKLFGKDLINNLNQQVNILENQIQAYQTKIDLANQEKTELQYTLGLQGVLFDEDTGVITNYNAVLNKHLGYVNTVIDHYNRMTAEQQEKYKDTVEEVKDNYELFKKRIQNYDKIVNDTIPQLQEEIRNNRDEQIEKTITKFTMAVEIELDLSQAKKDWNEFKKNIITKVREDDIVGNANANLENFFAYYDKGSLSTGLIPGLTDQIMETINQLNQINSLGSSSAYGDNKAQALEDLQKYSENLMKSLQDVEDVIKQVKESFYDMVDAAQDAFDEQDKEYEFLSDLIEHDKKLIQMLYGDDALDKINEYNQKQIDTDKRELQFQRQQKDFWWAKMQAERVRLEYLDKESDSYKQAEKHFKDLEQHWLEAVKDFNSKVEESIQHLLTLYQNNVSIIFQDLEKTLTKGKGLDYVEEEWELINDNADDYLDTINSMYEIQKLQDKFQNEIDNSRGDLKAQKSLTNLMNQQLKMLKDKDKLTQYDVDRANLLLQIEIKRLALQQSRNSKTKLRLRRDSQGNYNYQYISDESQISEAEQGVADLQNNLYNLDKDQYIKNQNEILKVQKDFNEKMKQLYEEYPIWTEQAEQKKQMLIQQYGEKVNGLVKQNQTIRINLSNSAFGSLANLYGTDVENFTNMSDAQQNILMHGIVPQWDSSVQDMTETIAGQGGLAPTCEEAIEDLDKNTKQYEQSLGEIETTAGVSFEKVANGTDENIEKTESLISDNQELIDKYNAEWDAIQRIIEQVKILTQAYTSAKLAAIAAATAANDYLNIQREKAISEAKKQRDTISTSPVQSQTSAQTKSRTTKAEIQEPEELLEDYYLNYPVDNIADEDVVILEDSLWNYIDVSKSSKKSSKKLSKDEKWERVVRNYNLLKEGKAKNKEDLKKNGGFGGIYADQGYQLYILKKKYGRNVDINDYRKSMGYKTGGYTGQWGNEGKIGILHEKELVLNAEDTKNILAAVESTRTMANLLKLINTNNALSGALSNLTNSNIFSTDQNVHITATFPSVNSRVEIEQAFSNLINRASQYSFNTRK